MNADISDVERILLSCIKARPCFFINDDRLLSNLEHYLNGYNSALYILGLQETHKIYPDGFGQYIASKYKVPYTVTLFSIIRDHSNNEKQAFDLFFELLDEYLLNNGYEVIPVCTSITSSWEQIDTFRRQNLAEKNSENKENEQWIE